MSRALKTESVVTLDTDTALRIVKADLAALVAETKPEEKLKTEQCMRGFEKLFHQFLRDRKQGSSIVWEDIQPPPALKEYSTIPEACPDKAKALLDKLVVLKLNGGLGTTMGCVGPKSLISVRDDKNFLDLTVMQIEYINKTYGSNVPLVLMNSFNTHADTKRIEHKYNSRVDMHMFEQSCYPRILKETLRPYPDSMNADQSCWYPPGHGDVYESFRRSGLLEKFIKEGKELVFISNIDNLGATIDLNILGLLLAADNQCEFVMEVTPKTRSDIKGGTLIQYDRALRLLEIAEVPKEHEDDFKAIKKFKVFNTNNLWVRLTAIDRLVKEDGLSMSIIVNRKTLENGTNVIQLETAAGAAIQNFKGAMGITVPRRRFLPVKTTADLLVVMSNLFTLEGGNMTLNTARLYPALPLVKLGDNHFRKVHDFLKRFESVPDLLELDHLTVSGDVTFGKHVSLKGTVIIIANHGERIDIPAGACLENKIVSGNLRILDH